MSPKGNNEKIHLFINDICRFIIFAVIQFLYFFLYSNNLASPEKPKIRVKDFARARLSQSFNEIKPVYIETVVQEQQVLQDIEIISLSSEDETVQKKPKGKAKRRSNRMPAIPRGRKDTPLKYKYHKIDEYFTKTKKEGKNRVVAMVLK